MVVILALKNKLYMETRVPYLKDISPLNAFFFSCSLLEWLRLVTFSWEISVRVWSMAIFVKDVRRVLSVLIKIYGLCNLMNVVKCVKIIHGSYGWNINKHQT